jgi:hypothetical protein
MDQRSGVAVVGVGLVTVYAAILLLQSLVFDPLAAVPGQSLAQIHAHLLRDGADVRTDEVVVAVAAAVGAGLAVGAAILGLRQRFPPVVMALMFLVLLAFGAPITFATGFGLGMDVADSYGVSGGDHTLWAPALYLTSVASFVGAVALNLVTEMRYVRRTA